MKYPCFNVGIGIFLTGWCQIMRRGEHVPQAFQAPVDVHASADGQVYMFKRRPNESAASSDDEELSVMEMRPRVFQEQELLEREVLDGDNLNKLALQYGCKVKIFYIHRIFLSFLVLMILTLIYLHTYFC